MKNGCNEWVIDKAILHIEQSEILYIMKKCRNVENRKDPSNQILKEV